MLDDSTRKAYLDAMGITSWESPDAQVTPAATLEATLEPTSKPFTKPISKPISKPEPQSATKPISNAAPSVQSAVVPGLQLLNQGSQNGLMVVLPQERAQLSNDARQLMSKMLNSIHFLPKETAFAVTAEPTSQVDLSNIKVILVMGNEAGRAMVLNSGAKTIAGSDFELLADKKMIVSWHPEELIAHPEHKKHAWNDLKLLLELFKQAS